METCEGRAESPSNRKEIDSLLGMTRIPFVVCEEESVQNPNFSMFRSSRLAFVRSNARDEENGRVRSASSNGSRETPEEETNVNKGLIRCNKIFIVLLAIEVSLLDPLFFYIPVINDRWKCVHLDQKLGTAVSVLRSLIDFIYAIYIIAQVHKHFSVASSRKDQDEVQDNKLEKYLLLIDFLAVIPLPQVVLLIIPTMRGSKFLNAVYMLRSVVLCQFVPRIFRTYHFISDTFGDPANTRFKFSPCLYMLVIEVIGAFWYFMSIERLMKCYKKACENLVGCVNNSFTCTDNVIDHTSLNDFCQKDGFFDFGIYEDALKHHVMEITYFPRKFLYCLRWSLQNLSGFGQNLQTSTDIWENLFAISTGIFGLLLFLIIIGIIIGRLQAKAEFRAREREKIRLKAIESMENWPPVEKLSENLKQQIENYLKDNWGKKTTDARDIFLGLPPDLQKRIKGELCIQLLEKEGFTDIYPSERDELVENVKLKQFKRGDYIQEVGGSIKRVVFILHGELEAIIEGKPSDYLGYGAICGEELIWDVFIHDSSFGLPDSTKTIRALTRVIVFVLAADKVRHFLRKIYYDHRQRVRRELCFDLIKKVKAFEHIGQDELSGRIELKLFKEGDFIVKEGDAIKTILLIMEGKLEGSSSNTEANPNIVLKAGDICGEELTWEVIYDWSSEFKSTRTIKALNRVQALFLPANEVRYVICKLRLDLRLRIRRELFLDFLKKVDLFSNMDEYALDMIYDSVMPKSYERGDPIMLPGGSIDALVLVVQGTIVVNEETPNKKFLKHGDLCGEELLDCASKHESFTKPNRPKTITALTRVQALVLDARVLAEILE